METSSSSALESVYVARGAVSADAMTRSLQALVPTRHRRISRHQFTLLDTFDGRVRRAGARLMQRGVNGASRLTWRPARGGAHVTIPLPQPVSFAWDLPEGRLQQAVGSVIGVRRLFPKADVEAWGSLLEILDGEGKTVARLWIESIRARLPLSRDAWQPVPIVITLNGLRGYEEAYHKRLVPLIESRPGVESCADGLSSLVLQRVGAPDRGDNSSPRVDVPRTARADAGARQIHLALLDILLANEPGLRANLDTEFLHDYRVALRRTRALLGQIRHVFPPAVVEHFSVEFSWVGRLTGRLRDIDVLLLALQEDCGEVPAGDLDALTAFLGEIRKQEHDALLHALDSDRYRALLAEWEAFLNRPAPAEPEARNAGRLLADVVSRRALRLSRRIHETVTTIDEHTSVDALHELRIQAKKLRYLIDITPPLPDSTDLDRILAALKKLQRVLGHFNDAQVQEARLLECGRALEAADGPRSALRAVRRLATERRHRGKHLRAEVLNGLERFAARDMQSACRRAFRTWSATGCAL